MYLLPSVSVEAPREEMVHASGWQEPTLLHVDTATECHLMVDVLYFGGRPCLGIAELQDVVCEPFQKDNLSWRFSSAAYIPFTS